VTEADCDDGPASRRYRMNRLEAFSDGVLAIAIFFLIPLGAFRITRSARSTLPPS
jgi:hypothetical protein